MQSSLIDGILEEFYKICEFPHGSLNEEKICAYLMSWLEDMGFSPVCDEHYNIMCDIPAAPGLENAPLTALQAHMDMVCAYRPDAEYDPLNDPIRPMVADGVLKTDGSTSLGADNCLAIATVLHLLKSGRLSSCGPLRLLFTAAEEIGLAGAEKMSPSWLDGTRYLLNLDGFVLDSIIVCSCGSVTETLTHQPRFVAPKNSCAYSVSLNGFAGGHSGYDIHEGRGNPIVLLGRFLSIIRDSINFELHSISGGSAPNAIPCSCDAVVVVKDADEEKFRSLCDEFFAELDIQYRRVSSNAAFAYSKTQVPETVFAQESKNSLLDLFLLYFNGVESQNPYFPDVTGSSSNFGTICLTDSNILEICSRTRFLLDHSVDYLLASHRRTAELCGFSYTHVKGESHVGDPECRLVKLADRAHNQVCGTPAHITATHVGLEASVFGEMRPELEIVTIGPDINNAHSPNESVPVDTIAKFADIMLNVVNAIANE